MNSTANVPTAHAPTAERREGIEQLAHPPDPREATDRTTLPQASGPPVIAPGYTFGSITDKISGIVQTQKTPLGWFVGFGISFLIVMLLLGAVSYLLVAGVGIWGVNIPVAWGFAIVNF